MKKSVEAWATVRRDPLEAAKVWIAFYPDYSVVMDLAEDKGVSLRRAVFMLWEQGNRLPVGDPLHWDSEDPHNFAYEFATVAEADRYIASF